ncbi:MAG TPA: hypothetical protein VJN89_09705 [Candidatus Acidoferrum sp.]|nr:hypothetical protein [Candidatus Acidoferrum sp.]
MRKAIFLATLLVLLLLGILLSLPHLFTRWRKALSLHSQVKTEETGNSLYARRLPPVPSISLEINDKTELVAYSGGPLIFCLTFANQTAMSAAIQNRADEIRRMSIQNVLSRGEISAQQAERMLASVRKREVPIIRLAGENQNWQQFVRFELQRENGEREPLQWPLKPAGRFPAGSVALDENSTPQLFYLLDPLTASQIIPGQYKVVAVLEMKDDGKPPGDSWRGRAESEPVNLSVIPKPAHLTSAQEEEVALQIARYYETAKDWTHALDSAQKALATNPGSIAAHMLVGDIKEASGDPRGALEAYQAAKEQFYTRFPNSYEPPEYLIEKISLLSAELRTQTAAMVPAKP